MISPQNYYYLYAIITGALLGTALNFLVEIENTKRKRVADAAPFKVSSAFSFKPVGSLATSLVEDSYFFGKTDNEGTLLNSRSGSATSEAPDEQPVEEPAPLVEELEQKPDTEAKPQPVVPHGYIAPGLVAAIPNTYKLDARGRKVCERDNDKPAKSAKDKPTHIDMECCLDPDEIPNPYCYYPREKYGALLDRYHNEKKEKYIERVRNQK